MVLQKRLEYGFNGYQVPPTPRAARSARRRVSSWKKAEDNQMCAFDLLATVAGKLLLEGETSPPSSNTAFRKEECEVPKDSPKTEQPVEDPMDVNPCDQGSSNRSFFVSELLAQAPVVNNSVKESLHAKNDTCSGLSSGIPISDFSEKVVPAPKMVNVESRNAVVDVNSSGCKFLFGCKLDIANNKQVKTEPPNTGIGSLSARADKLCSEDAGVWKNSPPAFVSSDNSVRLPFCKDHSPRGSLPVCEDNVKLVIRDDDEKSSGCTQPRTLNKAFRPQPRIGDRRIRRLLASKYWKVAPKLKDDMHFSNDEEMKHAYRNRNNCFKRQRALRDYPFKKRRLYELSSMSNSEGGISSDGMSSSPGNGLNEDGSSAAKKLSGAMGTSFAAGQQASFRSRDSHVKLKIKSFRVPEVFIEIPETATVGSLKRTVMEAMTAILQGELRVGVLLQGKKIRDDNKTLLQTGISHDDKLDALGFTLEPNSPQTHTHKCREDHSFLQSCDTPQILTRYPTTPTPVNQILPQEISDAAVPDPQVTNFGNLIESDHDSAPSPPEISTDKCMTDSSRALVTVPAVNVEALAMVPMRKSKRAEVAQRRIRRPFSVSEVEALVQAVEKLGTGRWRDVKLRAFDNAKHRTYVDLKDKWKTLVHTARISPQQRRGEPVPQELLDRVLAAHAYWSHHQAKQQFKSQPETCLLL